MRIPSKMATQLPPTEAWAAAVDEAGLDKKTFDDLKLRRIERIPTLALLATHVKDVHAKITEKLLNGHDLPSHGTQKYSGDGDVLHAVMAHLWEECCAIYKNQRLAMSAQAAPPPKCRWNGGCTSHHK